MDWALALSSPNAEHLLARDLRDAGYEHHFFKRMVSRAWHGKIVDFVRPAFPRYVFVAFENCYEVAREVWRVLGIVCFGEEVARVKGDEVERLVERCNGGDVLPPEELPEPFMCGATVHLGGVGIFAGHDAVYDRMIEGGKLRVMVSMFGRAVPVDIDARDVSSVVDKPRRYRGRRKRNRKLASSQVV